MVHPRDQILKVLANNSKGKVTEKQVKFKKRYGFRIRCPYCNWKSGGGGILTKKEAREAERAAKAEHLKVHENHPLLSVRQFADPEKSLQIKRSFHAAEIGHFDVEQAARQTTTSTSYTDIPGASITNGLTGGQTNLVIVTAQLDSSQTSNDISIRVVHGTTPTVEADSEAIYDMVGATTEHQAYQWWGVISPGSNETIKVQYMCDAGTVGADFITITVIKLTPDLTLNTDFRHALDSDSTTFTALETDLASNDATISHTPGTGGHIWLILGKARYTGITDQVSANSRINRSGASSNTFPQAQVEGENSATNAAVLMTMRTDSLTAASHTYTEKSFLTDTGTTPVAGGARTHSGIFMMDLNKFRNVSTAVRDDNTQALPNNTTAYGEQVATTSLDPDIAGDVLALGYVTMDSGGGGTGFGFFMRLQIDNTDAQDIPTPGTNDVTTKAYKLQQYTSEDRVPLLYCYMEDLSDANHTFDLDGSVNASTGTEGTLDRHLIAFTMELAATGTARTLQIAEALGITESRQFIRAAARTLLIAESLGVTEAKQFVAGGGSTFITAGSFSIRLSGGSSNSNPLTSLGGVKSSVSMGLNIFDSVSKTEVEAVGGDTEYRCLYIHNSHASLPMLDVILWVSPNTPAGDEIRIGRGTASVNLTEQTVANENTAPSGVAFVLADNQAQGLSIGNIPAGQHVSIWVRRSVPQNTSAHQNNNYFLNAYFHTDAVSTATPPAQDINGIQYPSGVLTADGYSLAFGNETFTFTQNFRTDGSMRCNFHGPKPSVMVAGYFMVKGASIPDEEVSAELNGGPHTSNGTPGSTTEPNSWWADNMDLGITDFEGQDSRVRFEGTHPNYTSSQAPTTAPGMPVGDVRNVWRGYIGLKINLDTNDDGQPDSVAFIGMVDIGGLNASNQPVNNWVVTYKRIFTGTEIINTSTSAGTPIKSPYTPYVATIGHPEEAENTIRIDQQIHAEWTNANPALRPYKYVTCKEVFVTNLP